MSDEKPSLPRPVPHQPLFIIAVALLVLAGIGWATAILKPTADVAQGLAEVCTMTGALVLAATVISRRNGHAADVLDSRIDEVTSNQSVLAYDVRRVIAHEERQLVLLHDLSGAMDELLKRVEDLGRRQDQTEDYLKRLPPMDVRQRLAELEARQETLAGIVAEGASVTLDLANSDVYELGKRVGREEAERERGKDQTP